MSLTPHSQAPSSQGAIGVNAGSLSGSGIEGTDKAQTKTEGASNAHPVPPQSWFQDQLCRLQPV